MDHSLRSIAVCAVCVAGLASACASRTFRDSFPPAGLQLGLGDRISEKTPWQGWRFAPDLAAEHELPLDLYALWLPRGWDESWIEKKSLRKLAARGTTPVLIHYFFGDAISREALAAGRTAWLESIARMAELARIDAPVWVVLEPEFNDDPPPGETSLLNGPEFGLALRDALRLLRERAPNVRVGACPGHFPGTQSVATALEPVARELDFIAYQEMRARHAPHAERSGYLDVAGAAVDYARVLQRTFGLPVLLAYVAVSTHDDWEWQQAEALRAFAPRREELVEAGVFGLLYFQLRDDPAHRGYFGEAERYFGLLRADGSPKPGLEAFRALAR